eukprot:2266463-Amphidinium_carterae.1
MRCGGRSWWQPGQQRSFSQYIATSDSRPDFFTEKATMSLNSVELQWWRFRKESLTTHRFANLHVGLPRLLRCNHAMHPNTPNSDFLLGVAFTSVSNPTEALNESAPHMDRILQLSGSQNIITSTTCNASGIGRQFLLCPCVLSTVPKLPHAGGCCALQGED